jgi:hypothetical protein
MFIATGKEIFEKRKRDLLKPNVLIQKLPMGGWFPFLYPLFFSKYNKGGIETVLQKAFDPAKYSLNDEEQPDRYEKFYGQ